jgi:hypothetical protein
VTSVTSKPTFSPAEESLEIVSSLTQNQGLYKRNDIFQKTFGIRYV